MKKITIALVGTFLLLNLFKAQAQLGLNDIIDQYTFYEYGYNDIIVGDSITGTDCYELDFTITPEGGVIGNPNLGDNEYLDYRENMTVAMKLHYAGLQNFMGHPDDQVWFFDPIGRMVETKEIQENLLLVGDKIFYLNIRGDFEDYEVNMVYYCGQLDRHFSFDNVVNYKANNTIGNTLEPYEFNMAPLLFEFASDTISTTILDPNYEGGICLEISVNECVSSTTVASDQICYNMGCDNSIIMLPVDLTPTICLGEAAVLQVNGVTSMGDGSLIYQWQEETGGVWTNIEGADNFRYSYTPIWSDNGNTYRIIMTNDYACQDTSEVLTLTINELPVIDTAPQDQHVCLGSGVTFNITASSVVGSLMYQWQKIIIGGSVDIAGATLSSYSFLPELNDNTTNYRVRITDANGCSILSSPVLLNVSEAISITSYPQDRTSCEGTETTFEVMGESSSGAAINYQWQTVSNGVASDILGATAAVYTFTTNAVDDGMSYQAILTVGGSDCIVTSNEVELTVTEEPIIDIQPVDAISCSGGAAQFEITAMGTGLSYQWQRISNGIITNIIGATAAEYTFIPALSDAGTNYQVAISNGDGCIVLSEVVSLAVSESPIITNQPADEFICNLGTVNFSVEGTSNSGSLTYQWQTVTNGIGLDIFGETNATYTFQTVITDNGNQYRAVVTNSNGCSAESTIATLALGETPIITEQPSNIQVCEGYEAVFGVEVAASSTPLTYQWEEVCYGSGSTNLNSATSIGLTNNIMIEIYEASGIIYGISYGNNLNVSIDGGASFTSRTIADGLGSGNVKGVYELGGVVYVATTGGLSYSTDGAVSFQNYTVSTGLGSNQINSIHGLGGVLCAATSNGLSVSINEGQSFVNSTTANGLGDNLVNSVYFQDGVIYAGTDAGLSISTDGGQTYVNRTISDGLGDNDIEEVYVSVFGTIYAATYNGLSYSTDGGLSFINQTISNGLGGNLCYSVHGSGNTVVVATLNGLGLSMDGGETFQNLTTTNGLGSNVVWDVHMTGNTIYAGTNSDITILGSVTTIQNATAPIYSFLPNSVPSICNYQVVISNGTGCSVTSEAGSVINDPSCEFDCADDYIGPNQLEGNQIVNRDYETRSSLASNQVIKFNAKVDYDALIEIDLLPGFEVKIGCEFDAFIDGCNEGAGGNQ